MYEKIKNNIKFFTCRIIRGKAWIANIKGKKFKENDQEETTSGNWAGHQISAESVLD